MNYLLDTHTFLWFINGEELNENILSIIRDPNNIIFLSIASVWEIAIKLNLNKLSLEKDFSLITEFLINNQIEILTIEFNHLNTLLQLPNLHRDPFDRLIIAQAISNSLIILTKDEKFKDYPAKINW